MTKNPWIDAFCPPNDDDFFSEQIQRRATCLKFQTTSIESRFEELHASLLQTFICSNQVIGIINKILSVGEGHAAVHYQSTQQAIGDTYASDPWGTATQPAIILSGLAGVGKTECIHALQRILASRERTLDLPMHKNLALIPAWFMSLRKTNTLNSLLQPYLELDRSQDKSSSLAKDMSHPRLLELARRASRRDGTCVAVVDELQFQTMGSQANTRVTGMLLNLLSLGPRLVYVCNFSLGHRLTTRRQEDRQRLLAHPIVMHPDAPDSPCFQNLLREYFCTLPDDFSLDPKTDAEVIHRYCFGIKRALASLMSLSWYFAKTKRGPAAKVGLDDVRAAYLSSRYTAFRDDVESLWRHALGDPNVREDLINPFPSDVENSSNVVTATSAVNEWKKQVAEAHVYDLMAPAEKAAELELTGANTSPVFRSKNVVKLPKKASSKASLLSTLEKFK